MSTVVRWLALVLVLPLTLCILLAGLFGQRSSSTALLAFSARGTPHWHKDIYLMDTTRRLMVNLTHDAPDDTSPVWSPDGQFIAFVSDRAGSSDLYVMDFLGKNPRRLTDNRTDDDSPNWSPDGTQLVFTSYQYDDVDSEIYIINLATGSTRRLIDDNVHNASPAWSPDGQQIAYMSYERNSQWQVNLVDVAGEQPPFTINGDQSAYKPDWSPDGTAILYASASVLYVYDVANDSTTMLAEYEQAASPVWSRDGAYIAFSVSQLLPNRIYVSSLYMMNGQGGEPRQLTGANLQANQPNWRP